MWISYFVILFELKFKFDKKPLGGVPVIFEILEISKLFCYSSAQFESKVQVCQIGCPFFP